ncbi:peptide methionine sulfoxide reductase msrB [Lodderomyces elongisporus NRRL YB-4239]|uniref:Peptide-methionine (R)-S-oxide reductase n=1 Tax=Lodderomyces elongisporus (strain ATCC 11503 / CBS 2605 / JCM 1781 / NBRC 1676 / NRRL YB-4239) TaxID=379508 RepID=A5DVJ4_LODEL|nr:peptide methionine sulfoxide reductase msrB [Lodderomyces elongisporus NRRL YB-4239]
MTLTYYSRISYEFSDGNHCSISSSFTPPSHYKIYSTYSFVLFLLPSSIRFMIRPFFNLHQPRFTQIAKTSRSFFTTYTRAMSKKSDSEWRAILSPEQFKVLREKGTEAPYVGKYTNTPASEKGVYECAACLLPLYKANTKFHSNCGWPAFYEAIPDALRVIRDTSHGMVREEIVCNNCDSHLGHIFKGEGYKTPTDERHCVNSISLKLNPDETI